MNKRRIWIGAVVLPILFLFGCVTTHQGLIKEESTKTPLKLDKYVVVVSPGVYDEDKRWGPFHLSHLEGILKESFATLGSSQTVKLFPSADTFVADLAVFLNSSKPLPGHIIIFIPTRRTAGNVNSADWQVQIRQLSESKYETVYQATTRTSGCGTGTIMGSEPQNRCLREWVQPLVSQIRSKGF